MRWLLVFALAAKQRRLPAHYVLSCCPAMDAGVLRRQNGILILGLMVIAMLATLGFAAVQQSTLAFSTLLFRQKLTAEFALLDTLQVAEHNGLYRTEAFAALPLWQQQSTAPHALIGSAALVPL